MLAVSVTITGMFNCSDKSYCDNDWLYAVLSVIVTIITITGRTICSTNNYCDNNGEVHMQC